MEVTAQIFSFLGLICYIISLQQNDKKRILQFHVIAYIFFAIQYFLLGAWSAAFMDIAALASSIMFYYNNKNTKKTPPYMLIIFILLMGITGIFTIKDLNSSIPIVMSIIFIYAIWQDNVSLIRLVSLIKSYTYILFNFVIGAYVSVIGNVIIIISALIAIIRFDFKKKNNT